MGSDDVTWAGSPVVEVFAVLTSLGFLLSPFVEIQKVHRSGGQALRNVNPLNLIMMLFNSALWLWYGIFFPVPPAVLSNTIGCTACCYYLASCWYYARHGKERMWGATAAVSTLLTLLAILFALAYAATSWSHVQQIGSIAMMVNILMYAAPLSVVGRVVSEKCSNALPPAQCFLGFLCSSCWLCVGLHRQCMPLIIPNACGVPLALLQIFLLWQYPRGSSEVSLSELSAPLLPPRDKANRPMQKDLTGAPTDVIMADMVMKTWEVQYLQYLRYDP